MMTRWIVIAMSVSALTVPVVTHGQLKPIVFSGAFSSSTQFYSAGGVNNRRPTGLYRVVFRPNLSIYDQIQLPFEFYLTSEDRGYHQPFNQFGVSPRLFGWLTLHGGYFSTRLSDMTFGDARLFGGGIELQPANFRLGFFYGRTNDAVEPDTTAGIPGVYRRTTIGGKLGFGSTSGPFVDINFVRSVDDSSSINASVSSATPKENIVASIAFGVPLVGQKIRISGEVGASALTNDTRSKEIESLKGKFDPLFTVRTSSQVDGAARISIMTNPAPSFSLGINSRWVGPGFVSLGYANAPNDVFEITVAPGARFLDNRIALRTSIGFRYNNLRSNRIATTRRTIGTLSANVQATPSLGFDVQYQNYGMRSSPNNDTLRVDNVSQSASISPRYTFQLFGESSTLVLTYSLQDFADANEFTSSSTDSRTHSFLTVWSLGLTSGLTLSTSYSFRSTSTPTLSTHLHTISETVAKRFLDERLTTSATIGYNLVSASSSDAQLTGRATCAYRLDKFGTLSANVMVNSYSYGASSTNASFHEVQGSVQYGISF